MVPSFSQSQSQRIKQERHKQYRYVSNYALWTILCKYTMQIPLFPYPCYPCLSPLPYKLLSHIHVYSFSYFCDPLSLTRVICVTMGLELTKPGRLSSGYTTEGKMFPSPNIPIANSSAVRRRSSWAPSPE